jgi:hypothetical protein
MDKNNYTRESVKPTRNVEMKYICLFDDYYYGFENKSKLPQNFCQKIIELENDFYRLDDYDDKIVEELAYLYKV